LQGSLTVSSGKRIAPLLPRVVGPWLAGTFDSDKSASRAALAAFETAFATEEKREAVWKLYQAPLLEYVEDAILRHTPQTLSDERVTSPDEAEAKHIRVISTALLVLDELLQRCSSEISLAANQTFQATVNDKKTWDFASHSDPSVRRAIYKLTADMVNHRIELDWKLLSSAFLSKSLHINQMGSSLLLINALQAMTRKHPSVWTKDYASKTPVSRRLFQYLRQGSQRGPEAWWEQVGQLIKTVPLQSWSASTISGSGIVLYEEARQLLNALHEGVVSNDEPRQNNATAWLIYTDIFFWVLGLLPAEEDKTKLAESFLLPIVERYLLASPELSQWITPASISLSLCISSVVRLESFVHSTLSSFFRTGTENLIETMKLSQPESSKTFKSSQDDVIQKARRFFDLQVAIKSQVPPKGDIGGAEDNETASKLGSDFVQANTDLVKEAVQLLRDRNGKPYGAAGLVYIALDKIPDMIDQIHKSSSPDLLSEFLRQEAPNLLESPSAELLVSILMKCRSIDGFNESFNAVLQQFLTKEGLRISPAFRTFVRCITNEDILRHPDLEQQILRDVDAALKGDDARWSVVSEVLANKNLTRTNTSPESPVSSTIRDRLLEDMMAGLLIDEREDSALKGLDMVFGRDSSLVRMIPPHTNVGSLLTRLLLLSDSPDQEKADRAARVASAVKKVFAKQDGLASGASAVEMICRQLDGEGEALPILSLVEIAQEALQDGAKESDSDLVSSIFPTAPQWEKALTPFMQLQPPPSIALITPLQGSAFLVDRQRRRSSGGLPRDSEGFSVAVRLTIFVTKLLEEVSLKQLTNEHLQSLYLYYPQALQIANDRLSIETSNAMWIDSTEEVMQEMSDVVAKGQKLLHAWLLHDAHQDTVDGRTTLVSTWLSQLSNIQGTSAQAFNLARAFTNIMFEASDLGGATKLLATWDASLKTIRTSPDLMKSAALLAVSRELLVSSTLGKRVCNELVADATEAELDDYDSSKYSEVSI
jgi:E3 ubiquitin-protein ligase listerin